MKSNFLTYNEQNQHFNIGNGNFPLLLEYVSTLDLSLYQHKPFESTEDGIRDVVSRTVSDIFGRTYAKIELPYDEFKALSDEYIKAMKLSADGMELKYIPVVIKSNNFKISIVRKIQ